MDFFQGTSLIATVFNAPYTFPLNNLAQGSYTFSAVATDDRGASTTSNTATITVTPASAQVYYIYTDQLNTPRVITNQQNLVVWRWDNNDPFGANVPDEDSDGDGIKFTCNLRFPGQYADRETGINYNYFRDYDPAIGRYVQSDQVGLLGGLNTYIYLNNNSLSAIDTFGLWTVSIDAYPGITPGGSIIIGSSPISGNFVTVQYGVGVGFGIAYEPEGERPGARKCETGVGVGVNVSAQSGVGGVFGGVDVYSGGVNANATPGDVIQFYRNTFIPKKGFDTGLRFKGAVKAVVELTGFVSSEAQCTCSPRSR